MVQISENAAQLIKKMTARNGFPEGGLRIGVKAGGCSGLSYTFAWEAAPRDGDHVYDGPDARRSSSTRAAIVLSTAPRSTTTQASSARGLFSTTRTPRRRAAAAPRSACESLIP